MIFRTLTTSHTQHSWDRRM